MRYLNSLRPLPDEFLGVGLNYRSSDKHPIGHFKHIHCQISVCSRVHFWNNRSGTDTAHLACTLLIAFFYSTNLSTSLFSKWEFFTHHLDHCLCIPKRTIAMQQYGSKVHAVFHSNPMYAPDCPKAEHEGKSLSCPSVTMIQLTWFFLERSNQYFWK